MRRVTHFYPTAIVSMDRSALIVDQVAPQNQETIEAGLIDLEPGRLRAVAAAQGDVRQVCSVDVLSSCGNAPSAPSASIMLKPNGLLEATVNRGIAPAPRTRAPSGVSWEGTDSMPASQGHRQGVGPETRPCSVVLGRA